jgi:hypothetical protein
MDLLHQMRIIEINCGGPLRIISCSRCIACDRHCDTSFGGGAISATNYELARYGYALLVWDSTHVTAELHSGGEWESHGISVSGDLTPDGFGLLSVDVYESSSFGTVMSGSSKAASGFGRDFTLYDLNVADTVIRYRSTSEFIRCGYSSHSWNTVSEETRSANSIDSLRTEYPPSAIVTFRRK